MSSGWLLTATAQLEHICSECNDCAYLAIANNPTIHWTAAVMIIKTVYYEYGMGYSVLSVSIQLSVHAGRIEL